MRTIEAVSGDGTRLVAHDTGPREAPPLLLLHGWAQSADCWGAEVLAGLAVRHRVIAPDLRGHGRSDAPAGGYDDAATWSADVTAVLAAAGATAPPVLVGWSYGGLVACDHLAAGGAAAGLVLVGAITGIGRGRAGGRVGPAMRAALPAGLSEDPATAVPALAGFAGALTADGPRAQALLGASLSTPPRVRAALFARETDHDALLGALALPVLVLHGTDDAVVDVRAGEHNAALVPGARTDFWAGAGHAPFAEDPARFVAAVLGLTGSPAGQDDGSGGRMAP